MISRAEYRSKVLGCWLGKNIGGTLGAPFEWYRGVNDVSYYTQELGGNPLPNDDLDIQLLWLIMLEEQGIHVNSAVMAEYWQYFVSPFWAEYGNAKINLQAGILPPYSGIRNNYFKDSCGAFIRSEIWACVAPGNPRLAVRYAYEDASIDHGDGEGMYAEIFTAAIESAAFLINEPKKLIDIGLSYIPAECGIAKAVRCVLGIYEEGKTWLEARNELLRQFRGSVFFCDMSRISPEDAANGFADGKMGWDAPSNIGILAIGLLYGAGDFDRSLCVTVNCGEDTDCTAATVGALFGIMHGVDSIPEKWVQPIGRGIKTACLNIGDLGYFGAMIPGTIDELTDRTEKIMRKIAVYHGLPVELLFDSPDMAVITCDALYSDGKNLDVLNKPTNRFYYPFFDVAVEYISGVAIKPGKPANIRLTVTNKYRMQAGLTIRWYYPDGWKIWPVSECKAYVGQNHWPDHHVSLDFDLTPPEPAAAANRFVIEITIDGRATVMVIPVHLVLEITDSSFPVHK